MTFWIIAACITVAALIILTLSICKVSAWGDRAMAAYWAEYRRLMDERLEE